MSNVVTGIRCYDGAVRSIKAGSNELYCGVKLKGIKYVTFNGRPSFCNLDSYEELERVVAYAHAHNVKVLLTANLPYISDVISPMVKKYICTCVECGVDALIVADIGDLLMIQKLKLNIPIHASSFVGVKNSETVNFLRPFNVKRIIAPSNATIDDIRDLVKNSGDMEVEVFAHGEGCSNSGGNCYLTHTEKTHPCCNPFDVYDMQTNNLVNESEILDCIVMCSLCSIPELIDAGVYGFKLITRCDKPEIQEAVTNLYRKFIDYAIEDKKKFASYLEKIKKQSHEFQLLCQSNRCYYTSLFNNPKKQVFNVPSRLELVNEIFS